MTSPTTPAGVSSLTSAGTTLPRGCARAGQEAGPGRDIGEGDNARASHVLLDDGRKVPLGPRCRHCRTTEARCARVAGCCADCTHFGPRLFLAAASPEGGRPRTACDNCKRIRRACQHLLHNFVESASESSPTPLKVVS